MKEVDLSFLKLSKEKVIKNFGNVKSDETVLSMQEVRDLLKSKNVRNLSQEIINERYE